MSHENGSSPRADSSLLPSAPPAPRSTSSELLPLCKDCLQKYSPNCAVPGEPGHSVTRPGPACDKQRPHFQSPSKPPDSFHICCLFHMNPELASSHGTLNGKPTPTPCPGDGLGGFPRPLCAYFIFRCARVGVLLSPLSFFPLC